MLAARIGRVITDHQVVVQVIAAAADLETVRTVARSPRLMRDIDGVVVNQILVPSRAVETHRHKVVGTSRADVRIAVVEFKTAHTLPVNTIAQTAGGRTEVDVGQTQPGGAVDICGLTVTRKHKMLFAVAGVAGNDRVTGGGQPEARAAEQGGAIVRAVLADLIGDGSRGGSPGRSPAGRRIGLGPAAGAARNTHLVAGGEAGDLRETGPGVGPRCSIVRAARRVVHVPRGGQAF